MVIATGFFDGVHLGHRFVIKQLVNAAKERNDQSMVVTFWPHPRNVLQNEARNLRLLTSLSEKKEILANLGVDWVEVIPFTKEFCSLTAEEYLRKYIQEKFGGKTILIGYDNRIGSDLATAKEVTPIAERMGIEVIQTEMVPSFEGDVAVSSTKIRSALEAGEVGQAADMLGYQYQLLGVVVAGKQLGRKLGFPTANMELYEPLKLVPHNGVYLVKVYTIGKEFYGMCNIGVRPTIGEGERRTIETNIFNFDEYIYGLDLKIKFIKKIRDEQKFSSLDDLKTQLRKDKQVCLEIINN